MAADDPVVLSAPQLIGARAVRLALGVSKWHLYDLIRAGDPRVMPGFLGKISGRFVWNAHELFSGLYASPVALWEEIARVENRVKAERWCAVDECHSPAHFLRLCPIHLGRMIATWNRAEKSTLARWRLLAMCQWVIDRNAHLDFPDDWDPFSGVCLTPGCGGSTEAPGRSSPLCIPCSLEFWENPAGVAHPGTL